MFESVFTVSITVNVINQIKQKTTNQPTNKQIKNKTKQNKTRQKQKQKTKTKTKAKIEFPNDCPMRDGVQIPTKDQRSSRSQIALEMPYVHQIWSGHRVM